jgi:tetratricopeptide (TPR) repeat protein
METLEKQAKKLIPPKIEGLDAALYYQRKIHLIQALDPYPTQKQEIGDLYCKLATMEDTRRNYDKAITTYESALEEYPLADSPIEHATLQMRRGRASFHLAKMELRMKKREGATELKPITRLDQALEAYQTASRIFTQTTYPLMYMEIQHQIGRCHYLLTSLKDFHYHATKALVAFNVSFGIGKRESHPTQYAINQYYLGLVHKEIAQETKKESDWKASLQSFQAAQTVLSPETDLIHFLLIQLHLTKIYHTLAKIENHVRHLHLAMQCFLKVLQNLKSVKQDTTQTARILTQIGLLYHELGTLETPVENWHQALRVYQEALRYLSRTKHPRDYGLIHVLIGKTAVALGEITDSSSHYIHARQAYQEALTGITQEEDPELYRRVTTTLKKLKYHEKEHHSDR